LAIGWKKNGPCPSEGQVDHGLDGIAVSLARDLGDRSCGGSTASITKIQS